MTALSRVKRELAVIEDDPPPGANASPNGDDLMNWTAYISGPPDSPYEGGCFYLSIGFPASYPFQPPRCQFLTRVYHPNISVQGQICLDILSCRKWTPSYTIAKLLLGLTSLLCDPNTEHGLRPDVIKQYTTNRKAFNADAKKWTQLYAVGNSQEKPNATEVPPSKGPEA